MKGIAIVKQDFLNKSTFGNIKFIPYISTDYNFPAYIYIFLLQSHAGVMKLLSTNGSNKESLSLFCSLAEPCKTMTTMPLMTDARFSHYSVCVCMSVRSLVSPRIKGGRNVSLQWLLRVSIK